jgi:hypothetical protein
MEELESGRVNGGASARLVWAALALLWAGCADHSLPALMTPQACGDRCSALNCPAGMRCSIGANCAARCEPEQLGNHP